MAGAGTKRKPTGYWASKGAHGRQQRVSDCGEWGAGVAWSTGGEVGSEQLGAAFGLAS
jgi:hypothetical protein